MTQRTALLGIVLLLVSFAIPAQILGQGSSFSAAGRIEGAGPPMSIGVAVSGIVGDVLVHAGGHVTAGELLVTLDCRAQQAEVSAQQARAAAAQATYDKFRNGARPGEIAVGEAVVNFSKARADEAAKTLQRTLALQEGVTVTAAHVLEVKRDARIAEAQLAEARAQLDLLRAGAREEDIRDAKALRDAAAAELDQARARLAECSVHAPAAGLVLDVLVNRGEFVSQAVPQPLLHILPDGPPRVHAEIGVQHLAQVCVGQHAAIGAQAFPQAAIAAQVASIGQFVSRRSMAAAGAAADGDDNDVVAVLLNVGPGTPALPIGLPVTVRFDACPSKS